MRYFWTIVVLGLEIGITFTSKNVSHGQVTQLNTISQTQADQVQTIVTENERDFQEIIQKAIARNLPNASMAEIMQGVAENFLSTSYQAGLLDQSPQETLVISFKKFDCVLFVETVLAIARNLALKDYTYQTFTNHLIDQRYENGILNGYCSRLHYFSGWIEDNQKRGNVQNLTANLGGIKLDKKLNFMSTHRHSYRQLINDDTAYNCIVQMEAKLQNLNLTYLPTNKIKTIYNQLQPGDIIGVVTAIPGLDFTHTGLVYHTAKGNIGFIHASPAGKVTIANDLQTYIGNVSQAIGIVVTRPTGLTQ